MENLCFSFVSEVESDLGIISLECVEVGSWCFVPELELHHSAVGFHLLELVVDLLVKHQRLSVHVENSDVVRSFQVVLDETDHSTGPFVPSVTVAWTLASVHLQPNLILRNS